MSLLPRIHSRLGNQEKQHRAAGLILLLCLLTAFSSCRWLPLDYNLKPGEVLFQDDFSHRRGGWPSEIDANGSSDYLGEAYHLQVLAPYTERHALPGLNLQDVRIQVEGTKIDGPDDNRFGILCRYQDRDHYYALLISTDGYFAIVKVVDGQPELLGANSMQRHDQLIPGKQVYLLEAECNQTALILRVDGFEIARVEDDQLVSGDVGLAAGTFQKPGTDILFDNFKVLQP